MINFFIGTESDHWLPLSVTHSPTRIRGDALESFHGSELLTQGAIRGHYKPSKWNRVLQIFWAKIELFYLVLRQIENIFNVNSRSLI